MAEFNVNRQTAIAAVSTFLEALDAYEASDEFKQAMSRYDDFVANHKAAIDEEERLAAEFHRLEQAVKKAGFFQKGNALMALAEFKTAHPVIQYVVSPLGFYRPRSGYVSSPFDYLNRVRQEALRKRDFLSLLSDDGLYLDEHQIETLAGYASGRALQQLKERVA